MPSILKVVVNFIKEFITYITHRMPRVSNDQYEQRIDTCNTCEHLIEETGRCGLCGCWVEGKAKWATTDCPDSRWLKINQQK